jgi:hypothetical protein
VNLAPHLILETAHLFLHMILCLCGFIEQQLRFTDIANHNELFTSQRTAWKQPQLYFLRDTIIPVLCATMHALFAGVGMDLVSWGSGRRLMLEILQVRSHNQLTLDQASCVFSKYYAASAFIECSTRMCGLSSCLSCF